MAETESDWLTPKDNPLKAIDNEHDTCESVARLTLPIDGIYEGKY
jgi:hypothetical protein